MIFQVPRRTILVFSKEVTSVKQELMASSNIPLLYKSRYVFTSLLVVASSGNSLLIHRETAACRRSDRGRDVAGIGILSAGLLNVSFEALLARTVQHLLDVGTVNTLRGCVAEILKARHIGHRISRLFDLRPRLQHDNLLVEWSAFI